MAFKLTAGNVDDRTVAPDLITNLIGKLFGDKGYSSQDIFGKLFDQGLQFNHSHQKNHEKQAYSHNRSNIIAQTRDYRISK